MRNKYAFQLEVKKCFFGRCDGGGNKISSKGIFVLYNHVKGISHVSEFTDNFVTRDN